MIDILLLLKNALRNLNFKYFNAYFQVYNFNIKNE